MTAAGRTTAAPVGHRRALPGWTAPGTPRRVSGPLRGRLATPRPVRRARRRADGPREPLTVRAVEFVRTLPDHALLDRVVRGRVWIAVLGLMLVGIVAMQVEVLKLGASEGHALQESAALQSRNEILRASVASASAEQRIEQLAASRYGMVMPDPSTIGFLSPNESMNAERAGQSISAPDATEFLASLPADTQNVSSSSTATGADATGTTASTPAAGAAATTPDTSTGDTVPSTPTTGTTATGGTTPGSTTTGTPSTGVPATTTPTGAAGTTSPGTAAVTTAASTTGGAAISTGG